MPPRSPDQSRASGGRPIASTSRCSVEHQHEKDKEVCRDLLVSIALYRDRVLRAQRLPEDFWLKPLVERWGAKKDGP